MNQASFSIQKSKLLNELKSMAKTLGRASKYTTATVLELTITDNKVTLVIPGAKFELDCKTKATAKATIGFFYFKDIVQNSKEGQLEVVILDKVIKVGITSFHAQTTFFEDDSILRSIKLPINYTDLHLLQLDNKGYTIEELRFNNLEFEIHYAKKNLRTNILKAKTLLGVYGVSKKEIEDLINQKINGSTV